MSSPSPSSSPSPDQMQMQMQMQMQTQMPNTITRFLVCGPLGHGSFARVSLALDLSSSSLFAIKSASSSSSAELSALLHERDILSSLSSPYILPLLGSRSNPSTSSFDLYLPFMDSGSLSDLILSSGGKLPEPRAASISRSILRGLAYLHFNRIVHCDIKGKNILLDSAGSVKIADFGSSLRLPSDRTTAAPANPDLCLRGTPLWMSPEAVHGVHGTPSDIWSLGCTLVEMLQGAPPYHRHTHMNNDNLTSFLLKLGLSQDFPPLPASISDHARDFLLCCLNPDPELRWTASQLLLHPFLCSAAEKLGAEEEDLPLFSPRSILDFHGESHYSSKSEEDELEACGFGFGVCEKSLESPAQERIPGSSTGEEGMGIPDVENWITVKKIGESWSGERLKPFMAREEEGNPSKVMESEILGMRARMKKKVVG